MSELSELLASLGLEQYHDALISEGFDTWETVQDITENDLDILNFKLGHRRKLQRYIASHRGVNVDQPLSSPFPDLAGEKAGEGSVTAEGQAERPAVAEAKRKYRRHPKPDENAPERPPSAYVLFSNHIREEIRGKDLSFTDIAKLVGQRWQSLSATEREPYETRAANLKETFNEHLAEYKKSEKYRQYAQYLTEFRIKHGGSATDLKRPRLEEELTGGSGTSPVISTPVVPKLSDPNRSSRTHAPELTHTESVHSAPTPGRAHSGVNSPVTTLPPPALRSTSDESIGRVMLSHLDRSQASTSRPREKNPTPPESSSEPAGYFDPRARHARTRSALSHQDTSPVTSLEVGPPAAQVPKPPALTQESSVSSVPSMLSYSSASSGLPWTPQTPRDESLTSRGSISDAFHSKAFWEGPRPILPPFQVPGQIAGNRPLPSLQPLSIPDRSFTHPSEPSLRLPLPGGSHHSNPAEKHSQSTRPPPPPPPQFVENQRLAGQRAEQGKETSRSEWRRDETGIELLARAVDAEQRDRRLP